MINHMMQKKKQVSEYIVLVAMTIFVVSALALAVVMARQQSSTVSQADEKIMDEPTVSSESPQFYSNVLLIKLSKEVAKKAQPEGNSLGIANLDSFLLKNKSTTVTQVVTPGPKSIQDHEIFRWYRLQFDSSQKLVSGVVDYSNDSLQINTVAGKRLQELSPEESTEIEQFTTRLDTLAVMPEVEAIDVEFVSTPLYVPNDFFYSNYGTWGPYQDLWYLHQINPETAWDQALGATKRGYVRDAVTAVLDSGLDYNHPDIASAVWKNMGEIPNNGIDDDNNGYIDDVRGWDFGDNDNDPFSDGSYVNHGNMIAGIAASSIDNDSSGNPSDGRSHVGVYGFSAQKVMPLKIYCSPSNPCGVSLPAIIYAADNGAHVSNHSYIMAGRTSADAIKYAHDRGMLSMIAAGNSNVNNIYWSSPDYGMLVTASGHNDVKPSFSNWGDFLDVAAPGVDIMSLNVTGIAGYFNYYGRGHGTSYSAPLVAGLANMLFSVYPDLSNEEVRQIIKLSADDIGEPGVDRQFGSGRINVSSAVAVAEAHKNGDRTILSPLIRSPRFGEGITYGTEVIGDIAYNKKSVPGEFTQYALEIGDGISPDWVTLIESEKPIQNDVLHTFGFDIYSVPDGEVLLRLKAFTEDGSVFYSTMNKLYLDNVALDLQMVPVMQIGSRYDFRGHAHRTAIGPVGFERYVIEYQDPSSQEWKSEGITLENDGYKEALDEWSYLGFIDTSALNYPENTVIFFRIRAILDNGLENSFRPDGVTITSNLANLCTEEQACAQSVSLSPEVMANGNYSITVTWEPSPHFSLFTYFWRCIGQECSIGLPINYNSIYKDFLFSDQPKFEDTNFDNQNKGYPPGSAVTYEARYIHGIPNACYAIECPDHTVEIPSKSSTKR